MALIVAISSTFIEAKLVNSIPFLEKIYTEGIFGIPGAWVNNICSIFLSFMLGFVFQAQGIAIMVGGLLSIPMSNMYFGAKYQMRKRGINGAEFKETVVTKGKEAEEWVHTNGHYFTELGKTLMFFLKVVTLPVRLVLKANSTVHAHKDEVTQFATAQQAKAAKLYAQATNRSV